MTFLQAAGFQDVTSRREAPERCESSCNAPDYVNSAAPVMLTNKQVAEYHIVCDRYCYD